jgi:hypothetical protein
MGMGLVIGQAHGEFFVPRKKPTKVMKTENKDLLPWLQLLSKTALILLCLLPRFLYASDDVSVANQETSLVDFITHQKESKIRIPSGEYSDGSTITIPPWVDVYGAGREQTIIHANIMLSEGSSINDLSIVGASVRIVPDADVSIRNVTITRSPVNALETFGVGALYLQGVNIQDAGEKGISVQHGGYVTMLESEVIRSQEEGLDIRENTSVYIEKSKFLENKESGIEIVSGSSTFALTNSVIANNHASGISVQYYDLFPDQGRIYINDNIIIDNQKSGVSCDTPSGGSVKAEFWKSVIQMQNNNRLENNSEAVNKRCKFESKELDFNVLLLKTEHDNRKKSADEKKSLRASIEREVDDSLPAMDADLQRAADASDELFELQDSMRVRWFGLNEKEKSLYKEEEDRRHVLKDKAYVTWKKTTSEKSIGESIRTYNEVGFILRDQKAFWENHENGIFDKWLDEAYQFFGEKKK